MHAISKAKSIAALLCVLAATPAARASGPTDLWYNANESGWGANVVRQGDTLFMTLFVYDQAAQPLWLVAPSAAQQSSTSAGISYSGPLYQTTGPWLGGNFNPASVNATQVGTATFLFQTQTTATLTYTVNGTPVSKALTRQTWRANTFVAGSYIGAMVLNRSGCGGAAKVEIPMVFTITMSGSSMGMTMQPASGPSCSASGTYSQNGSQGRMDGSGSSCVTGGAASITVSAIEASDDIVGRITFSSGSCVEAGTFAGAFRG